LNSNTYTNLEHGITCIDADYVQAGTACFYLLMQGDDCAIIETGTSRSVPALQRLLQERGIAAERIRFVIPTHVHLDHAGGVGTMMAAFPEATLLIHPRGARHMSDPERLVAAARSVYGEDVFAQLYGTIQPVDPGRIRQMQDGESVSVAGRRLEFRHTRGHAEHHFCIWDERSKGWFSGDMFGVSYPWCRHNGAEFLLPSTTPSQFDPQTYLASLELLAGYQPQRMYLTHFGVLSYSREKSRLLAHQIDAYADFASDRAVDLDTLQRRLTDFTVALLHDSGVSTAADVLRSRLAFDMHLNAQGLLFWRERAA
jgi:glyoxylase-like metal-dependent hydrolase (beta-lactamase superfamily II)